MIKINTEPSQIDEYKKNGYITLKVLEESVVDEINSKVEELVRSGKYKENTKIYKYSDGPRIVESWKYIELIKTIAQSSTIKNFLKMIYKKEPIPFSTINFTKGSNQPLHSDYVHFGSIPEGYLCGLWIALEDIKEGSGELQIAEGSNSWPIFKYAEHGLKKPKSLSEIQKNYNYYENWVKDKISKEKTVIKKALLKKGEALLWDFNLLHGGAAIKNKNLTRKSLVIHYHFSETIAYNPNFSFFEAKDSIVKRNYLEIK